MRLSYDESPAREAMSDLCRHVFGETVRGLSLKLVDADAVKKRASWLVLKSDTVDYKTGVPAKSGLFDPNFGATPLTTDGVRWLSTLADDDEVDPSAINFGRIALATPMVHPFFVTHGQSELAAAGDVSLDAVDALAHFDNEIEADAALRFVEAVRAFTLTELPVLPAQFRGMQRLESGQWLVSSINDAYRTVINRNTRLSRLMTLNAPTVILHNERRMLFSAVSRLFRRSPTVGEEDEQIALWDELPTPFTADDIHRPTTKRTVMGLSVLYAMGFEVAPKP